MKTGIYLSYIGLGANLLHLSYCHQIAKKHGPVTIITLCKNLKEALADDLSFVTNELARLYKHLEKSSGPPKVVIMGSHTLSLFDNDVKFFEANSLTQSYDYLNYLVTWHPMDMIHQPLLKRDCWSALQAY